MSGADASGPIRGLTNRYVVTQFAEEAAFLWTQRCHALNAPHYSLRDLTDVDDRVEAHLAGLRLAGAAGWTECVPLLEEKSASGVFAAAQIAFALGERDWMRATLHAGCSSPGAFRGLVSALAWTEYDAVRPWIQRLIDARNPLHRAAGIAACAMHGDDPGPVLEQAVDDDNSALRARALRAAGVLKRRDLVTELHARLRDPVPECAFWAAWSLCLLGEPSGIQPLAQAIQPEHPRALQALNLVLRVETADQARRRVGTLVKADATIRLGVIGVGVVGDPTSVPWLIATMQDPALARVAGEAFTMITGIDLAYHDLNVRPSVATADAAAEEGGEPAAEADPYDERLPVPSSEGIEAWWNDNGHSFSAGTRYLTGRPVSEQGAHHALLRAKQRQRVSASLQLACLEKESPLFDVCARGTWQQERLAGWNSST